MKSEILIRVENLCARYPSTQNAQNGQNDILKNISFTLHEGEKLCVIGPNGCGKTTLLRVLAGTLPYKGSLTISEKERSHIPAREAAKKCAFLTQLTESYFSFTVYDTVMLGRYAHQEKGFSARITGEDKEKVEQALSACGIGNLRNKRLSYLSGGQLQRVFLARAFAQDPAVLLLDEPTNHLDLYFQLALLRQIDFWISGDEDNTIEEHEAVDGFDAIAGFDAIVGHGAIGVFHDLTLALRFADTILLLENGRVADYGPTKAVITGKSINQVYGMDVAATMRELLQNW